MTDEEYVRANWEFVEVQDLPHNVQTDRYCDRRIAIWSRFTPSNSSTKFVLADGTKEVAWAAAAEFTRDRREQIRQLERELVLIESVAMSNSHYLHTAIRDGRCDDAEGLTLVLAPWFRILARLESALDDLKRGMDPKENGRTDLPACRE